MNLRQTAVRFLTCALPVQVMRRVYAFYATTNALFRYGDSTFPRIISVEINTHCNRECSYCPNSVSPAPARLIKDEVWYCVLERLKEIKWNGALDFIFFSEPTLHPQLAKKIREAKEACPKCLPRICTNGDLLTESKVRELMDAGLTRIYCMRHNPTPPGWRDNINGLDWKFPGMFVLMDIDEVESNHGLEDFGNKVEVKIRRRSAVPSCNMPSHCAQITIDGDWNLCCTDYARSHAYGSLLQYGFMEIWRNPEFRKIRMGLMDGKPPFNACRNCSYMRSSMNA
jgi:hypothetical protein